MHETSSDRSVQSFGYATQLHLESLLTALDLADLPAKSQKSVRRVSPIHNPLSDLGAIVISVSNIAFSDFVRLKRPVDRLESRGIDVDEDLARAHPYTGDGLHLEMQEEPPCYDAPQLFTGGAPASDD